ncbi:MAG: peptidase S41 [Parcubacteria group bacterium CG23_combo_of_CG06-09_8_20_14_all_35_9]|nr:MAG: peptidase S41 [Parcubacteria group bacterium CG23_combo_of_CG06-09_8_20_14_all_35_9]
MKFLFKKNLSQIDEREIKTKYSIFKRYTAFYLATLLVISSFIGGLLIGQGRVSDLKEPESKEKTQAKVLNKEVQKEYLSQDVDFDLFWDVWKLVKEKYYGQPVNEVKLFYGSIAGIVAALEDPYSVFLDPETAQKFSQELSGSFEGIGAEIGIKDERLTIIAPLPDTPAEKSGLKAGDKVYKIDDFDTANIFLELAVNLIRGKKGTQVRLTIMREGLKEPIEIAITRDTIVIEAVKWEMVGKKRDIAYIKISTFNENTEPNFNKAIEEILTLNPKGLILDLRNNPGGFLDVAIKVADKWIKNQVVVVEKFGEDKSQEFRATNNAVLEDIKTIVLVNKGSASGSEIVTGALQDWQKATIIGEKTFGKGSVQDFERLKDGSAVKLTIAQWLTPKGRLINEEGITPDIEIKLTEEDFNSDKDPQLGKAIELLSD